MWSRESWCSCIMFLWSDFIMRDPQILFWFKPAPFRTVCNLLNTSHFCQYSVFLPFPYGFKTCKHAWFSFMLFCTASMMQKNDTRCDAQTSVFLTPKNLFYTIPLWLVLFTQPWPRQERKCLLRSVKKWSTSHVFPSSPTRKPIECQWGIFPLQ